MKGGTLTRRAKPRRADSPAPSSVTLLTRRAHEPPPTSEAKKARQKCREAEEREEASERGAGGV